MSLVFNKKLNTFLFLVIFINLSLSYKEETEESMKKRFNFLKKYEKEVVPNGNISFEFEESLGTYCKVQKDTFRLEFTISVRNEYLTCESKLLIFI